MTGDDGRIADFVLDVESGDLDAATTVFTGCPPTCETPFVANWPGCGESTPAASSGSATMMRAHLTAWPCGHGGSETI